MTDLYDLAIIGGGPAGVAAGVYASRKQLKTIFIAKEFGGQSIVSPDIQNWIGTTSISGNDLAKNLEEHLKAYAGNIVDIEKGALVTKIEKKENHFVVNTDNDKSFEAKTVLIATGSTRRKLEVPGAKEFDNKGLTYCASCDGPLFADKDVAVIGGGNAALETVAQLLAYTKSVTLLNRSDNFKADEVTVKKVLENPKMTTVKNASIKEIKGDNFVNGLVYTDKDGKDVNLKIDGIFVEIGLIPTTDFVSDLVERNKYNQIIVDPKNQMSKTEGLWAAGDCTDGLYHQNNIAAGDAVKALEDIYMYIHAR